MKTGFTLIEILVVITIIGVLSGVGINNFSGVKVIARDNVRQQDLQKLSLALETYLQKNTFYVKGTGNCKADTPTFYTTIAATMVGGSVPTDPESKSQYCYIANSDGSSFRLFTKLEKPDPKDPNFVDCPDYNWTLFSPDLQKSCPTIADAPSPNPSPSIAPQSSPAAAPPPPAPTLPTLRVFVTKDTYTGNLGGINGADMKCQSAAGTQPALKNSLWRAWVSDPGTNAKDRIADAKYTLINGVVVASSKTDLLDGSLTSAINLTENGGIPSINNGQSNAYVWTGTNNSGNKTGYTCSDWVDPFAMSSTVGNSSSTSQWTGLDEVASYHCNYQRHLYCFEQPTGSSTGGTGCIAGYQDFDGDGYTTGGAQYFCNGASLPFGYKSSPSAQADCYDQNTDAHPGQTQYFISQRGDGSFDYDCSGSTQTQYPYWGVGCGTAQVSTTTSQNSCFISWICGGVGAATIAIDCGKNGNFLNDQQPDLYQCDEGGAIPVHSPNKTTLACH